MSLLLTKPNTDPVLLGTTLALLGLGTIMIGSASVALIEGEPLYYLTRHLGALGLGLAALLVAIKMPIDWWNRLSGLLLTVALGLLVLVLVPGMGETVNGSARWIDVGPVGLQASEPARLFLLIYLASYAVRKHAELGAGFKGFARPMLLVACASLLLLLEPDYGATVVLTVTSLAIVFAAGARLRDVALAFVVSGAALTLLATSSAYRLQRLMAFRNPWSDPLDTGYQLVQSLIAIGSGSWFGAGLGASVQKLDYLPEGHTDFVFAVLAEELGFVGGTLVIALYGLLVYRAIDLGLRAIRAKLTFHGLLATGIGLSLGLQAAINIGVNTGLLPTKGLTLPLISYGRTSTVVTLLALGVLFRIERELALAGGPVLARGPA
jgi:cell division protein FtsW